MKFITVITLLLAACTNHTSREQFSSPPTIVSITPIASGHQILIRAVNAELVFAGYTLFVGTSETDVSAKASGTACSTAVLLPNTPTEYSIEASSAAGPLSAAATGENANRVCKFPVALQSGQYVLIKSQILSIQPDTGIIEYRYSPPSNIVSVP